MGSDDLDKDGSASATDERRTEHSLEDAAQCARCGYVLYGLADDQGCPECAFPVGASRQGPWLKFADPRWLRRLTIGAFIVMVTTTVVSPYHVLIYFLPNFTASWYLAMGIPILFVLDLAGYWLLSAPDPSHVGEQVSVSMRSGLRLSLLASLGVWVITVIYFYILRLGIGNEYLILVAVGILVGTVTYFFRLSVIGLIATRIPDPRCERLAGFLRFAYLVPFVVFRVFGMLGYWLYLQSTRGQVEFQLPRWCLTLTGMLLIVAWGFVVYLLVRFALLIWREYRVACSGTDQSASHSAGNS